MRFNIFLLIFLIYSCTPHLNTYNQKKTYAAKGFAYIYNENDFNEKIIKSRMNNNTMQISHQNLKTGTLIQISNPKNKKSIVIRNIKRIKYPDFYKILITKPVAEKLELNEDLPLLEILEIKKNKSFVAEKAKIYNEEKKLLSKAPVASVQISNISKKQIKNTKKKSNEIYILVGNFYSMETANFLRDRIIKEVPEIETTKLKIKKINEKETQIISGPYKSVNLLKNEYIKLKKFGFEELDVFTNE